MHGATGAIRDLTHLNQHRVDIEHRNPGETPHQRRQQATLRGRDVDRGHVSAGSAIERTGRHQHEEVRTKAIPLHLAQIRDPGLERFASHIEHQPVTDTGTDSVRELGGE